ncbi:MAG: hypothetical protein DBX90_02550 [Lentisphaerae bacterium]|nr:MAG: hypothetical protein DBX90_02550 [Lentisphaerota bacterium]
MTGQAHHPAMRSGKITIRDVAEAAGCSPGTVSFVINRSRPISAPVRRRVLDAIERLHYTPYGRRKAPERRKIVLLADEMASHVVDIFSREITRRGFLPETCYIYDDYGETRDILSAIGKSFGAAGVLNLLPQLSSVDLLKWCKGIPSVIYIRNGSMLSAVTVNFKQGMQLALRHLARLAHRKAAFLYYTASKDSCMLDWISGFEEDRTPGISRIAFPCDHRNPRELCDGLDRLYAEGATAFIASTMDYAVAVLQWSYRKRLRIPEDLSLLVFEDSEIASRQCVPLTAVQLPLAELAYHTVSLLLAQIDDRPVPPPCRFNMRLREAASTGPAPELKID